MISSLNGGNTAQPPEPVLSPAETFFIGRARRALGIVPDAPACPRPALTEEQARRVLLFQQRTESHRLSKRLVTAPWPFPIFDDEPSQRCVGDDLDTARRCRRARERIMEAIRVLDPV